MKTAEQNVAETLKGKKVLFLENGGSLDNGLDCFEEILIANNIEYKALFVLKEMPLEEVIKNINEYDCIVFMTQWVYDISKQLKDYMFSLEEKKIVVEVYLSDPTWYYKPKSAHDVYIYSCIRQWKDDEKQYEKFYKLSQKPYWDYKNKFDK